MGVPLGSGGHACRHQVPVVGLETTTSCPPKPPTLFRLQWFGSVPHDLATHLQHNLLSQDRAAGGLLRVALSVQLQTALEEAHLFDRLRMGVPGVAQDLLRERPRLRALWVGAVEVARAYNAVLGSLSAEDRRLCRDRLR